MLIPAKYCVDHHFGSFLLKEATKVGEPAKKYSKHSRVNTNRRDVSPLRCDICAKKFALRMDMITHKEEDHKKQLE